MIPEYNKVDTQNDDLDVIQCKIDAMKKALDNGTMSGEEYNEEKDRIMNDLPDYTFDW